MLKRNDLNNDSGGFKKWITFSGRLLVEMKM